jgi:hypothetical protein
MPREHRPADRVNSSPRIDVAIPSNSTQPKRQPTPSTASRPTKTASRPPAPAPSSSRRRRTSARPRLYKIPRFRPMQFMLKNHEGGQRAVQNFDQSIESNLALGLRTVERRGRQLRRPRRRSSEKLYCFRHRSCSRKYTEHHIGVFRPGFLAPARSW